MKNFDKLFDSTAYLLCMNGNCMNYTKLIKELYFSDRESIKETGFPITGDSYFSMPQGPVLSALYDLIRNNYNDKVVQQKWNETFSTNDFELQIKDTNFSRMSLSKRDKKILTSFSEKFKDMDWKEVVDNYAHNPKYCPEWSKITRGRKKLSFEDICNSIGFSEEERKILVKEYNYYLQLA